MAKTPCTRFLELLKLEISASSEYITQILALPFYISQNWITVGPKLDKFNKIFDNIYLKFFAKYFFRRIHLPLVTLSLVRIVYLLIYYFPLLNHVGRASPNRHYTGYKQFIRQENIYLPLGPVRNYRTFGRQLFAPGGRLLSKQLAFTGVYDVIFVFYFNLFREIRYLCDL